MRNTRRSIGEAPYLPLPPRPNRPSSIISAKMEFAAAIGPVARRRRRGKTLKGKNTAPPSIQHTISAGAIPRAGRIRQPLAKG